MAVFCIAVQPYFPAPELNMYIDLFQMTLDCLLFIRLDLALDTNDSSTLCLFVPKLLLFRAKIYTYNNIFS